MNREIHYDWQIDTLQKGDRVSFCINDIDCFPDNALYLARRNIDLLFKGDSREEPPRQIIFGVARYNLSALRGRLKITPRCTIRIYSDEDVESRDAPCGN